MAHKKVHGKAFNIQAVKLGREIGFSKAAKELGINTDTLYGWNKRAKDARLDPGPGTQTPDTAMSLTEEVQKLRQQTREQAKQDTSASYRVALKCILRLVCVLTNLRKQGILEAASKVTSRMRTTS